MKLSLYVCDVCREDGEIRLAVAEYEGEETYHACATHLKHVKNAKLPYRMLSEDELSPKW